MKKGAVAGAIVWSAPLLTSTPAFAATGRCSGSKPCVNFYYAKVEGSTCTTSANGDGSECRNLALDSSCDSTAVTLQDGCAAGFSGSHSGTTATFNYPAGAVPIFIQLKPGADCYNYEWTSSGWTFFGADDGGPPGTSAECANGATFLTTGSESTGYTVVATWPSGCNGLSHIGTYFCL